MIAGVYRAEDIPRDERLDPAELVDDLGQRGASARFLPEVDAILAELAAETRPGDVVTVMSNGAFGNLHERLLDLLRFRAEAAGGG